MASFRDVVERAPAVDRQHRCLAEIGDGLEVRRQPTGWPLLHLTKRVSPDEVNCPSSGAGFSVSASELSMARP